jgi:carboxyl-terminal processing protease
MSEKRKLLVTIVGLVVIVAVFGGWVSAYSPDYYQKINQNIDLFQRVYIEVTKNYVEELDPQKFMKAGLNGMLSTLDPYTVIVEKEDNEELQIMSSGKYGGLGMRIGLRDGWPTVVEPPFDGTPALKAGIREGDQVISIDTTSTKGLGIGRVANLLRGEVGSEVFLKVRREGENDFIEFRLIRGEITVTDVQYVGFIEEGIGFIRLAHFSRNAGADVRKAINDLKKGGLKALIFDLRYNPGGLLDVAVDVSENFIEKGELIVSTEGRIERSVEKYHSKRDPVLGDLPLVVLVNGYSASASEIVAGAIQDLDRGVIIGQTTFGKGLVQTVVPISNDAAVKVTTAKYLVPSGRSIQDPTKFLDEPGNVLFSLDGEGEVEQEGASTQLKESTDENETGEEFRTAHGRKVYASHGIKPDVVVEQRDYSRFELELLRKTMPFQFAVIYAAKHPEIIQGFQVDDDILSEFQAFLQEKNFDYESEAEAALKTLEEQAKKSQYLVSISPSLQDIKAVIETDEKNQIHEHRDFITEELEQEISAKLWGTRAEIEASFDSDEEIQKALEILADPEKYRSILSSEKVN